MTQEQHVDDLDLIGGVPAGGGAFKNYGKLTIGQRFIQWNEGKPSDVTAAQWKALPQKDAQGKNQKGMEILFGIDVQELNTNLQFTYERKVAVNGADWYKTLVPSIEAILGKGSMAEGDTAKNIVDKRSATLRSLNGKYVCVEDAPQQPRKNAAPDAKQYSTIKFVKVFDSREACYAEWKALSGNSASASANGTGRSEWTPPDYDDATWASVKGEAQAAVSAALEAATSANKAKPKVVKEKAIADAKIAAIKKFSEDYGATEAQVEHLVSS